MTVAPPRTLREIPFTLEARQHAERLPHDEVINCYHIPEMTAHGTTGDFQIRTYDSVIMRVDPEGRVIYVAHRADRPEDDPDPCVRKASTDPRGPDRSPGRKGSRKGGSGSQHPATAKELLERCRAANLDVNEMNKGGHYQITAPEVDPTTGRRWRYPPTRTSGAVHVSMSDHKRNILRNSGSVKNELGVDLREVDPKAMKRAARAAAKPDPVPEPSPPPVVETVDTTPIPESANKVKPVTVDVEDRHVEDRHPETDSIDDRLRFVTSMRGEGYKDREIADAMGWSPGRLSVFLGVQRRRGNPLAPPQLRKDPRSKTTAATPEEYQRHAAKPEPTQAEVEAHLPGPALEAAAADARTAELKVVTTPGPEVVELPKPTRSIQPPVARNGVVKTTAMDQVKQAAERKAKEDREAAAKKHEAERAEKRRREAWLNSSGPSRTFAPGKIVAQRADQVLSFPRDEIGASDGVEDPVIAFDREADRAEEDLRARIRHLDVENTPPPIAMPALPTVASVLAAGLHAAGVRNPERAAQDATSALLAAGWQLALRTV